MSEFVYAEQSDLLATSDALIVALDQVQDPHNLGAICRTAECAGATGLVIPERRSAEVTPAVAKAAAGAVEHLPWLECGTWPTSWRPRRALGCGATGPRPDAEIAYDSVDYTGGVVLVLGSEGRGLRPRVAATCDALVAIPLRGRIESLGVSAAAAVLLYAAVERRARLLTAAASLCHPGAP